MINNRQVNFWRGDKIPPTIYHIWIKDNSKMLLFNGSKWIIFLDNAEIVDVINKFQEALDDMQSQITGLSNKTINNKSIKDNPVLNGTDLLIATKGHYIQDTDTISATAAKLDKLLTTQIFE